MYRRRLYAPLIAAALLAACCAEAGVREWSRYTSDNFALCSDRKPEDVARLLENVELFHRAVLKVTAWRLDKESAARKYLRKLDADAKDAARPLSLSVVLHHYAAEYETARKLAEQALALAADDAVVIENLSHWQCDSYCNAQVHGTVPHAPACSSPAGEWR